MGSPLRVGGGTYWLVVGIANGRMGKVSKGGKGNYYEILYKLSCFNPTHLAQHVCLKLFQLEDDSQDTSKDYPKKLH